MEEVFNMFHEMAQESGIEAIWRMFNARTFRDKLGIPTPIWKELEPPIKEKINEIRDRIKKCSNTYQKLPYNNQKSSISTQKSQKLSNSTQKADIPAQYPSMKPRDTIANLVNSLGDIELSDGNETDDDMLETSVFMVKHRIAMDPPSDIIDVKAHFEYCDVETGNNKLYAITDGGADSCILGKNAHVLSYTGRYANLVGYDPKTTRTEKVPIVTALIKARSNSIGNHPVLLKVHEAPYNPSSPITLLSEYQIREYGLVIDSVAKKHRSAHGQYGTQKFQVNSWVHIDFEDRGDSWGLNYFP